MISLDAQSDLDLFSTPEGNPYVLEGGVWVGSLDFTILLAYYSLSFTFF